MAYKNIHDNFWRDKDIRQLTNEQRLFLLYAITNPQAHMSGIYYLPLPLIEHETGWPISDIEGCIDTLSIPYRYPIDTLSSIKNNSERVSDTENTLSEGKFFLKYDYSTNIVWIRNMLKFQVYMKKISPKIVTGIKNHLISLPLSPLLAEYSHYYSELKLPFFDHSSIPYPREESLSVSESISESKSESVESDRLPPDLLRKRFEDLCKPLTDENFNAFAFVFKAMKSEIPIQVIEKVLERILIYKDSVKNKWGYAIEILKREYAEFNYAQAMEKHNKIKNEPIDFESLFSKLVVI